MNYIVIIMLNDNEYIYFYYMLQFTIIVSSRLTSCNNLCYFKVIFKFLSLLQIYKVLTDQRVSFRSNDHYIDLFTRRKLHSLAGEKLEKTFHLPLSSVILYVLFYLHFNVCLFFSIYFCFVLLYRVRKCTIYEQTLQKLVSCISSQYCLFNDIRVFLLFVIDIKKVVCTFIVFCFY